MKWFHAMAMGLLLVAAQVPAAPQLTQVQIWSIHEAARAGGAYDNGKPAEFAFVPTLQAILGQESSFCIDKHKRDPESWGCGQLTVKTARLFDAKATAYKLMHQDRYNIWLAATYLAYCRDRTKDWTGMVRCYKGWGTKHWEDYITSIRNRLRMQASED